MGGGHTVIHTFCLYCTLHTQSEKQRGVIFTALLPALHLELRPNCLHKFPIPFLFRSREEKHGERSPVTVLTSSQSALCRDSHVSSSNSSPVFYNEKRQVLNTVIKTVLRTWQKKKKRKKNELVQLTNTDCVFKAWCILFLEVIMVCNWIQTLAKPELL